MITVKALIEQLSAYPQDAKVFTYSPEQFPADTSVQLHTYGKDITILDSNTRPNEGEPIVIIY